MLAKRLKSTETSLFPDKLRELEPFSDRFDAFRVQSDKADIYFASYPAGTVIEPHSHDTENHGIITAGALYLTVNGKETRYGVGDWYTVAAHVTHSARFEEDTAEIEIWFKH